MAARGAARGITLASTMQKTALREYTNLYLMLTATAKRTCTAAPQQPRIDRTASFSKRHDDMGQRGDRANICCSATIHYEAKV